MFVIVNALLLLTLIINQCYLLSLASTPLISRDASSTKLVLPFVLQVFGTSLYSAHRQSMIKQEDTFVWISLVGVQQLQRQVLEAT